jgi:hypothetical protein
MTKIIDDDFLAVMRELPAEWKVDRWDRGGMGWIAQISYRRVVFELVSDRGYIEVSRIVSGKPVWCEPPEQLRLEIGPKEMAELILSHAALN